MLMTRHYSDLGSASDCMKQIFNQSEALLRSGSNATKYGISSFVSHTSFRGYSAGNFLKLSEHLKQNNFTNYCIATCSHAKQKTYFNQSLTESSDVIGMAFTCSTFRL